MKRLILFTLLLSVLVLLIGPSFASAEKRGVTVGGKAPAEYFAEQTGKSYAVVIGIDDYQNPKIGNLKYAVADAKAVAKTLEQRGYQVTALYNEQATRRAIESELRSKLPRRAGKQDRVLIFYAGHGQDDTVEGGQTMGYLLPVDSDRDDIPATGISMGTVKELADALPAKHALFLLDVCFGGIAGTVKRGSPPAVTEAYLKQITREKGRHLITAGEANQEVIEAPKWGHSVFTYFLLKGLNEGLADQDDNGIITARELHSYLESRVFGEAQLQGHQQKPVFSELSGEQGQFVFFTSATGKPGPPAAPPQISGASTEAMAAMTQRLEEMERRLAEQSKAAQPPKPIEEARARPYEGFSNVPTDEAEAAQFYEQYCQKGNLEACTQLARQLAYGHGVVKDQARAFTLARKSCEGGHALGCGGMGKLYFEGWGVPKDEDRARSFWQKGCEGNAGPPCFVIARGYSEGLMGFPKDSTQATKFFNRAAAFLSGECEGGAAYSCAPLGYLYVTGQGLAKDVNRGVKLFERSCDRGVPLGCINLGYTYENGIGVTKNEEYARVLYRKTCTRGEPKGCELAEKR